MEKYVGKAMTPSSPETEEGENGPFYRYFYSEGLDNAMRFAFENRHILFFQAEKDGERKFWGEFFKNLRWEIVASIAVKVVGKYPWHVILDTEYSFPPSERNVRVEIECVRQEYGNKAFVTLEEHMKNVEEEWEALLEE